MTDRSEILQAVRQVLFNEVFPQAKADDGSTDKQLPAWRSWRDWVKVEMRQMLLTHLTGNDMKFGQSAIEGLLYKEIRTAVKGMPWTRNKDDFKLEVQRLAREQAMEIITEMVKTGLVVNVTVDGQPEAKYGWVYTGPDGEWYWAETKPSHEMIDDVRPATGLERGLLKAVGSTENLQARLDQFNAQKPD